MIYPQNNIKDKKSVRKRNSYLQLSLHLNEVRIPFSHWFLVLNIVLRINHSKACRMSRVGINTYLVLSISNSEGQLNWFKLVCSGSLLFKNFKLHEWFSCFDPKVAPLCTTAHLCVSSILYTRTSHAPILFHHNSWV